MSTPSRISSATAFVFCAILPLSARAESSAPESGQLSFGRDVRPILSDKCFACHGPDDGSREANLRLDSRQHATAEREGQTAIVPGDPDASLLLKLVAHSDPGQRMPPPRTGDTLSKEEIATLRRWIAEGAQYEPHWAFQPVESVQPPTTTGSWARNDIDHFVLKRLEAAGLAPSPDADRVTLLRRLYLDLIGLPPPVDRVDAFLRDERPDAYEQLVDELLASRHFGERWGRHWLDQARYADSHGYTGDGPRSMWPYRDWVIRAFNDDMPFDRFTSRATGRRFAPRRNHIATRSDWIPSQHADQYRGRYESRSVSRRAGQGSDGHDGSRLARD